MHARTLLGISFGTLSCRSWAGELLGAAARARARTCSRRLVRPQTDRYLYLHISNYLRTPIVRCRYLGACLRLLRAAGRLSVSAHGGVRALERRPPPCLPQPTAARHHLLPAPSFVIDPALASTTLISAGKARGRQEVGCGRRGGCGHGCVWCRCGVGCRGREQATASCVCGYQPPPPVATCRPSGLASASLRVRPPNSPRPPAAPALFANMCRWEEGKEVVGGKARAACVGYGSRHECLTKTRAWPAAGGGQQG